MAIVLFFVAQTIIPDFQVNSEDYPGNAPQLYPAIATCDSGGVVIWYDLRPPASGMSVFGSLLNANGDTIGSNWRLNEDTTTGCMSMPAVDCDSMGNFTITYIQLNYGTIPDVAVKNNGEFIVAWTYNSDIRGTEI